jgi:glycosyltransferase involved in cell wall biosynthesis
MQAIMTHSDPLRLPPRVLIVGGEDVHARIELMRALADDYDLAAAGTARSLAASFARSGFRYFSYPLARGLDPLADFRGLAALRCLLRRFRPRIVHAFDTKPGVYGCLAAWLARVPVVVSTVTGLGSLYTQDGAGPRLVRGVYERLQRLASHRADHTVFQNREDREQFVARRIVPAGKSSVIPGSGVRTDLLDPARFSAGQRRQVRASLGVPADALLVTMISRVIRTKGVPEFVAAARQVRQRFPSAHFLLVGPADPESVDGYGPAELADLARVIHWPGPRQDVPQVLAASDLFVLPSSLREGIPRVLLEAASMGLPLVTTDAPGCNEVVEEGVNGFLVPLRDPAALSQAILHLLGSPDLRRQFGRLSRQRALERFDLAVVVGQTRRLYRDLLAQKAPARALSR